MRQATGARPWRLKTQVILGIPMTRFAANGSSPVVALKATKLRRLTVRQSQSTAVLRQHVLENLNCPPVPAEPIH